jgi:hypothetical protein
MAFIVVYDANVLYPNTLRDLLIRIAQQPHLVQAKWTDEILGEMSRALRKNRPDITEEKTARLCQLMNDAVRDCLVTGYQPPASLRLPIPAIDRAGSPHADLVEHRCSRAARILQGNRRSRRMCGAPPASAPQREHLGRDRRPSAPVVGAYRSEAHTAGWVAAVAPRPPSTALPRHRDRTVHLPLPSGRQYRCWRDVPSVRRAWA